MVVNRAPWSHRAILYRTHEEDGTRIFNESIDAENPILSDARERRIKDFMTTLEKFVKLGCASC